MPFLSYGQNAYLGRMVELILADAKPPLHLEKRYETDMAEGLKMMAMSGHGVAFLPESAVAAEVRGRKLARAGDHWAVHMEFSPVSRKARAGQAWQGRRAGLVGASHRSCQAYAEKT